MGSGGVRVEGGGGVEGVLAPPLTRAHRQVHQHHGRRALPNAESFLNYFSLEKKAHNVKKIKRGKSY